MKKFCLLVLMSFLAIIQASAKSWNDISQLKHELEKHEVNLLSITLRYLKKNRENYLTYATDNMIAVVLYVNIELNNQSIQDGKNLWR